MFSQITLLTRVCRAWPAALTILTAAGIGAAGCQPARATQAPVLAYPLDQTPTTGTGAIIDATGGTSGTLINTSKGLPALVTGQIGNAWDFSVINSPNTAAQTSSISVGYGKTLASLGDITQTSGLTVGFWVNRAFTTDNSNRVFGISSTMEAQSYNGSLSLNFNYTSAGVLSLITSTVGDGKWHHVVATLDFTQSTNNAKVYVDNVLKTTKSYTFSASFTPSSGSALIIGARYNGSNNWPGKVDDFVVFDRPLSAAEVGTLYSQGSSAFIAPLVSGLKITPYPISMLQTGMVQGNVTANGSGTVTTQWSQVSGPGTATFGNPSLTATTVNFPTPGVYDLRLTATRGALTGQADLSVNVAAAQPPTVSATATPPVLLQPSQTTTLSATYADVGGPGVTGLTGRQTVGPVLPPS